MQRHEHRMRLIKRFKNSKDSEKSVIADVLERTDGAYIIFIYGNDVSGCRPSTYILWDREAALHKAAEIAEPGTLTKLGAGPLEREPEPDAPLVRELLGALYDCVETLEYVRRYVQAVRIPDLIAVLSRAREVMARTESRK